MGARSKSPKKPRSRSAGAKSTRGRGKRGDSKSKSAKAKRGSKSKSAKRGGSKAKPRSKSAAASKTKSRGRGRASRTFKLKPVPFNKLSVSDQDFIVNQLKAQKCLPGVSCSNTDVYCNSTLKPLIRRVLKIDPDNLKREQMCKLLFEYRNLNSQIINARRGQSALRKRIREKSSEATDLKSAKARMASMKNKEIRNLNDNIELIQREKAKLRRALSSGEKTKDEIDKLTTRLARRNAVIKQLRLERKDIMSTPSPDDVVLKHTIAQLEARNTELVEKLAEQQHIEDQVQVVQEQKHIVEEERAPLVSSLAQKESALHEIEQEKFALEDRLMDLQREEEERSVDIIVTRDERMQRSSQENEIKHEIERKKKILKILKARNSKQDPEYYILHINRLEKVIRDKNEEVEEVERKIKELEKLFSTRQDISIEVVQDLKDELEDAFRIRNNIKSKMIGLNTEVESLRQGRSKFVEEIADLQRVIRELTERARRASGLETELHERAEDTANLKILQDRYKKIEEEHRVLRNEFEIVKGDASKKAEEINQKDAVIRELNTTETRLKEAANTANAEVSSLKAETANLQHKEYTIRGRTVRSGELQGAINKLDKEMGELETQKSNLYNTFGGKSNVDAAFANSSEYALTSLEDIKSLEYALQTMNLYENALEDILVEIGDENIMEFLRLIKVDISKSVKKSQDTGTSVEAALNAYRSPGDVYGSDNYYAVTVNFEGDYGEGEGDYNYDPHEKAQSKMEKLVAAAKGYSDSISGLQSRSANFSSELSSIIAPIKGSTSTTALVTNVKTGIKAFMAKKYADSEDTRAMVDKHHVELAEQSEDYAKQLGELNAKFEAAETARNAAEATIADEVERRRVEQATAETGRLASAEAAVPVPEPELEVECKEELAYLRSNLSTIKDMESVYVKKVQFILGRQASGNIRGANVIADVEKSAGVFNSIMVAFNELRNIQNAVNTIDDLLKSPNPDCVKVRAQHGTIVPLLDTLPEDVRFNILSLFEDVAGIGRVYIRMLGSKGKGGSGAEIAYPAEIKGKTVGGNMIIFDQARANANKPTLYEFGPYTKVFHNDYETLNPRLGRTKSRPTTNLSVYEDSIESITKDNVDRVVNKGTYSNDPYNIITMVYGQSGAGKTYTLNGSGRGGEEGIMYLSLNTVIEGCKNAGVSLEIESAFLQLFLTYEGDDCGLGQHIDFYNTPSESALVGTQYASTGLVIKDGDEKSTFGAFFTNDNKVKINTGTGTAYTYFHGNNDIVLDKSGATVFEPLPTGNLQESLQTKLASVNRMRPTRSTVANPESSRSHLFSIFKLKIDGGKPFLMTFVDLGGNENTSSTNTGGQGTVCEGRMINASLIGIRSYLQRYAAGFSKAHIMTASEDIEEVYQSLSYNITLSGGKDIIPIANTEPGRKALFNGKIKGLKAGNENTIAKIFFMLNTIVGIDSQTQHNRTKVALFLHIRSLLTGNEHLDAMIRSTTGIAPEIHLGGAVGSTGIKPAPGTLHLGAMILGETPKSTTATKLIKPPTLPPKPGGGVQGTTPRTPVAAKPVITPRPGN